MSSFRIGHTQGGISNITVGFSSSTCVPNLNLKFNLAYTKLEITLIHLFKIGHTQGSILILMWDLSSTCVPNFGNFEL
jgi:hypothetical protein